MADKTITCKDCGSEFVFTEREQEFYKEKGFDNEPQRCADCRKKRKQQRNNNNRGFRR
ncbi:zinc-ribbon domain-containing protein [Tissierella sp. MSJ-40]|uniref:Zinc-ribbon domain-containing protein n=1 Tax=Tissierella simiarum TaxID=2841534 RepID=A0ABS6E7T4_9FIRM|nr:zinc-ribbon domain-containing protein [Tissierella simiarum]MBU5438814.1 zinc-ribbon domain-containing protein [Tissierella simiarum]